MVSADGVSGIRRGKSFLKADKVHKVSYVPGIYDGTFEMTVGSDGKPVLKLTDVDFVAPALISMKDSRMQETRKVVSNVSYSPS